MYSPTPSAMLEGIEVAAQLVLQVGAASRQLLGDIVGEHYEIQAGLVDIELLEFEMRGDSPGALDGR